MNNRNKRLTYRDALTIAEGLFSSALNEFQFSAGQAWAFTLDELDSVKNKTDPKGNIIVLTAIYKLALVNNVELSKSDDYTNDMLLELKESYQQFDECIFDDLNMSTEERLFLKSDIQLVSNKYL
ncbi:hypothetical protein [Vibrio gazogenes]|uniref:Uncharacterized protein n=1 Tax=Vibrio gazogenes TaxID=687 RepID=A0A1Z2SLY4_VIBGA|nr:hypothetical protein [Vibrio gazogenes]ASA58211.1 hypothetical protein BSQ33_21255 [Vibrio gazogenes]